MAPRTPRIVTAAALALGLTLVGAAPAQAAIGTPAPLAGCPIEVYQLFEYEGSLYFTANGVDVSYTTWKLEGSTCVQADPTTTDSSEIFDAVEYGGALHTAAQVNSTYGHFTFDGTALTPVVAGGDPLPEECYRMTVFDGEIYCIAYTGADQPLYSYDGTNYTDHFAAGLGDVPSNMIGRSVVYSGLLYFVAEDSVDDLRLYSYDGTTFVDLGVEALSDELFVHNGELYYAAVNGLAESLFRYNGTTATAVPGSDLNYDDDMEFVTFNGDLYFRANNGDDDYLYRYNGTTVERVTGGLVGNDVPDDPENPVVFDGLLLMNADGPDQSNILYAWNGSTFSVLSTTAGDMEDPLVFGGALYFSARDDNSDGDRLLWRLGLSSAAPELADTGLADSSALLVGFAGLLLAAGTAVVVTQRVRTARPSL